jgi:hypothetical protein
VSHAVVESVSTRTALVEAERIGEQVKKVPVPASIGAGAFEVASPARGLRVCKLAAETHLVRERRSIPHIGR